MITIKEIANAAGVTPTTVSNVIHGHLNKVSPQTVEKIRAILKEENYVPRFGLNALTNRGSGIIGVLINTPDFAEGTSFELPFYGSVIGTLENLFREKGYYTMVFSSKNVEEITKMAMGWNADGMIAVTIPEDTVASIEKSTKKPVVSLDMDEVDDHLIQKHYGVMSMDYKGGRIMAEYLLDCKVENIIYISNTRKGADLRRYWGARDVYRERRGPEARMKMIVLPHKYMERLKVYDSLRSQAGKNTALFFCTDLNAVEAVRYFQEKNLKVPEDISVTGFDNNIFAKLCQPGLTTVNCDGREKADAAGRMLIQLIEGKTVKKKNAETDVYVVERGSVRKQR